MLIAINVFFFFLIFENWEDKNHPDFVVNHSYTPTCSEITFTQV